MNSGLCFLTLTESYARLKLLWNGRGTTGPMKKLTKRLIDTLKTEKPSGVRVYDSELPGFLVDVFPSGKKTFSVRFGSRDRRRFLRVGRFGIITVDQAREKARQILAAHELGQDPAGAIESKKTIPTFTEWVKTDLEEFRLTRKRPEEPERYLTDAAGVFGKKGLAEVTPSDVAALLETYSKRPAMRNRALTVVSASFGRAIKRRFITSNPATGFEKARENPARARTLSPEELGRLVAAIEAHPDLHVRAAFRLLLETGARSGEVLAAKWADFDLDEKEPSWRLPDPKAGTPQVVPLAPETAAWLRELPRVGLWVIPGENGPRYDLKKPWERIRKAARLEDVRIHDIRRTVGKLIAQAAGIHTASAVLRHHDIGVTAKHYSPVQDAERRKALAEVVSMTGRRKAG